MDNASAAILQEKTAGAAPAMTPIQRQQRFASMDVLRGIALLGIIVSIRGWRLSVVADMNFRESMRSAESHALIA